MRLGCNKNLSDTVGRYRAGTRKAWNVANVEMLPVANSNGPLHRRFTGFSTLRRIVGFDRIYRIGRICIDICGQL